MPSKLKLLMSEEYKRIFDGVNSMLFFDYQSIAANDLRELRNKMEDDNIKIMIIRNRVFVKTMAAIGYSGLEELLLGPVAVAFGEDEGTVIKASKFLQKFYKKTKSGEIKGGLMDGAIDDAKVAKKYKDLLTHEEMLSMISGQLLAMGAKLAGQITGPAGQLASQIKQKSEELEAES